MGKIQKEIAVERKRQANILKEKIRKQKLKRNIIIGVIAGILGLGILTIEFYIITNL